MKRSFLSLLLLIAAGCASNAVDDRALLDRLLSDQARDREFPLSDIVPTSLGSATLETLLPPSRLRGADGLACHAGRAFLSEAAVDRLREVHADGSTVEIALPRALAGPGHLAAGNDGSLWVAARRSGSLWRRSVSGTWSEVASELAGISGIAVSHDTVYVSQCFDEDAIVSFALDGSKRRVLATQLGCPSGIALVDESLLVALVDRGEVLRLDPATGKRRTIATGLKFPVAVRRVPDDELVVLESGRGVVRSIGRVHAEAQGIARSEMKFEEGVSDLAWCGESVLVSNAVWGSIDVVKPWPGKPRRLIKGGLLVPQGAALLGDALLVSDGLSIKVVREGSVELLAAHRVTPDFPPCSGLNLGSDGAAYVTVPERGEIVRLDLYNDKAAPFSSALQWPTSLTRTWTGELHVAETATGQVLHIGPSGEWWPTAVSLLSPVGLVADGSRLLVTEPSGGRVLSLREGRSPLSVASGLAQPAGVAVDPTRRIFIAERGTGQLAVRNTNGSVRRIVTGLALGRSRLPYPLEVPLVAARDGSLLLASPGDGSVLRIRP